MTRDNDRFDDDAPPGGYDEPTHPNLDLGTLTPDAYRIVRIPPHTSLSRLRYRRDPFFKSAVDVAYKWLDDVDAPEDVFVRYGGRRIKVTRNLLDGDYYGGDVEPTVAVVTDDARVDALLDWADDPASGYARRETPPSIDAARARVDDATADLIDDAETVYENTAGISRAEFEAFVADVVETAPVEPPSSGVGPGGSTAEPRTKVRHDVGLTRTDLIVIAAIVAAVAFVLFLLVA